MKKLFVLGMIFSMLCALGVSAVVTTQDYDQSFSDMVIDTPQSVAEGGADVQFRGFGSVIANETFVLEFSETVTLTNATITTLSLIGLIASEVVVVNGTSLELLDAGNYTFDEAAGTVAWDLTGEGMELWDLSSVVVSANKTHTAGVTAIDSDFWTQGNVNGAYGTAGTLTLINPATITSTLGGHDINTTYTIYRNDAVVSCGSTQATIYAAFGLLALVIIVGAGWLLVSIFKGGSFDGTSIIVAAIGFIGLAITIMVGFVITNQVAASICS